MALYELVMRGTYFGNLTINRFNYVLTGTPAVVLGSFALVRAFFGTGSTTPGASTVVGQLQDIVSSDWSLTEIEAKNIYDPTDFYTQPFLTPVVGDQAAEGGSPFEAYGFRTNRVRSDIGRGTKRFAGVAQAGIETGGVISSGFLPAVQEVATAMTAPLEYDDEGNTLTFSPAVVQKEMYTTPPDPKAYKYYDTLVEQMDHVALGILWEAYPTVRSQVSRQYGRGA